LFIPGLAPIRTATRVVAYTLGLAAWVGVTIGGKKAPVTGAFPAKPWLIGCLAWLFLSMLHPNSYSLLTAVGQVALYTAVMAPAFWAGDVVTSPRQISRLLAVLFLCNAASATMGLGQVFYPERLNPPVIPVMLLNPEGAASLMFETADGRKVLRPCGLTDTPGAAAPAGAAAALIGLCFALRPFPWWKRLACVLLAFVGVAVIYYSQVRSSLIMLAICVTGLTVLLAYRGEIRHALELVGGGTVLILGALLWVSRTIGVGGLERFKTLVSSDPGNVLYRSRGAFVWHGLEQVVQYPLGYGLGWWGMIHMVFRDPIRITPVWVEVMIQGWVYDGGLPLLVLYFGAVVVAMIDSLRIALSCRDRELAFLAAVIVALNTSIVALCFSYPVFLSPSGIQFWMLAAALHAADAQVRASTKPSRERPEPARSPRPAPRSWPSAGPAA
jgi:hypothetical protein